MFLILAIALVTLVLVAILTWLTWTYTHWQRHGIPYVKPTPFIGTLGDVLTFKKNVGLHINDIYNDPVFANEPVVGIYMLHQPALLIREPQLIKSVLIKNFQNFHDRYANVDVKCDTFGAQNLFMCKYDTWSKARPKFSPTFSSGKLKQMFPLMLEIGNNLDQYLVNRGDNFDLEVKKVCGLFTTDQISSIAFGIQTQSFLNPINDFVLQNIENLKSRPNFMMIAMLLLPKLTGLLGAKLFSEKYQEFLRSSLNSVIKNRLNTGEKRNDLIDTLIKLRKEALETVEEKDKKLYDDMLLSQASIFYLAGYETSLTTMAFTLYLLAKHPEIQNKLRNEIRDSLEANMGKITYESLKSIEYLDMVIKESLRLYPVVSYLDREHKSESGELDTFSLKPYHNYTLKEGMPIFISTLGIHKDPKYWPNPELFDPDRFAPHNSIPPYAYMPFGIGPRNCIGDRMALLEVKIGILNFLKNYEVQECEKTVKELKYGANTITLMCKDDLYLKFVKNILIYN